MSKATVEPLFRMALSRIDLALDETQRVYDQFPSQAVMDARWNLALAASDLKRAQEFAAAELGFEVRESMPT